MANGMGNAENVLQKCDDILNSMLENMQFIGVEKDTVNDITIMTNQDGKKIDSQSVLGKLAAKQGAGVYTVDPITLKPVKADGIAGTLTLGNRSNEVQQAGANTSKTEGVKRAVIADLRNVLRG